MRRTLGEARAAAERQGLDTRTIQLRLRGPGEQGWGRVQSGVSPGRNVAAARLPGWNDAKMGDYVIGFSKDFGPHAEENILEQVAARGRDPQEITALYTERQPCSSCDALLDDNLEPGTPISWSVPWGDNPILKAASNESLKALIMKADK